MDNIDNILYKILEGSATEGEIKYFAQWIEHENNLCYFNNFKKTWHILHNIAARESINSNLKSSFINRIKLENKKNSFLRKISIATSSAAAVISLSFLIWYNLEPVTTPTQSAENAVSKLNNKEIEDIVLYSSSGEIKKIVELANTNNNIAISEDGKTISYNIDLEENNIATTPENIEYNTLFVPRGKRICVNLSDGTKLWINSETTVTYPVTFPKNIREIVVDGNIYVEVAKDATRPFIAKCGDIKTTALGTSFEINNYNKNHQRISLLEGSVSVENNSNKVILTPNSEAVIDSKNQNIEKREIDGYQYARWRENTLIFDNSTLSEVMINLERWHNVKIVNNTHNLEDITFSGKLEDATLLIHLELISKNIKIQFIEDDDKIIVWN